MKEMVGGCCVCSDDRGWAENPLVYCDGQGCNVAVHQACYGIVNVPTGNWYCRKCENQDRLTKVRCELCPNRDGALKPTDKSGSWAHVVCALYIPEVRFGNVTTMEPIILHQVPPERFNKACYICEEGGRGTRANFGACMTCNKSGCKAVFHVTCAQALGLLCEEAGNYQDNVKYCGYCHHHYTKLRKGGNVKTIPPYRPVGNHDDSPDKSPVGKDLDNQSAQNNRTTSKRKLSTSSKGSRNEDSLAGGDDNSTSHDPGGKNSSSAQPGENTTDKISHKKRKGKSSPDPSMSPRPTTPATSSKPALSSNFNANSSANPSSGSVIGLRGGNSLVGSSTGSNKPDSIIVQVPLEAAGGGAGVGPGGVVVAGPSGLTSSAGQGSGGATGAPAAATTGTPASGPAAPQQAVPQSLQEDSDHPSKRSRSQSSEKNEKGRRSKRNPSSNSKSSNSAVVNVKSSPEPSNDFLTHKIKKEDVKDVKLFPNGVSAPHMLGNQLNPASTMADTLSQEVAAHSIYTSESQPLSSLVGPRFPKPYRSSGGGSGTSVTGSSASGGGGGGAMGNVSSLLGGGGSGPWGSNSNMPQSLEQLLERQWEQGSQFLMEQAQHFDIASLLSCLHQLNAENAQIVDHVNSLQARRDHLLAVNARLAIPLVSPSATQVPGPGAGGNNLVIGGGRGNTGGTHFGGGQAPVPGQIVENGLPPQEHSMYLNPGSGGPSPSPNSHPRGVHHAHQNHVGVTSVPASSGASSSCYVMAPSSATAQHSQQSSVLVRAGAAPSTSTQDPNRSRMVGSGVANYPNLFTNPQQSPVVIRRDGVVTEVHHPGGNQPSKPS